MNIDDGDMDAYSHIPQGGPHIFCNKLEDGRHCAVAVMRKGTDITVITVGAGKTEKEAVDSCEANLEEAMKEYIKEYLEEEFDAEVISIERIYEH